MSKIAGLIILALAIFIIITAPVRNYYRGLLHKGAPDSSEAQIIGPACVNNYRVAEIQQILKEINLDPGAVDGTMGEKTRQAIKVFQKSRGLRVTGKIDQPTQLALAKEKEKSSRAKKTKGEKSAIMPPLTAKGRSGGKNQAKGGIEDEIISYRLKSKNRTKLVQSALKKAGFFTGEIDGKASSQTKQAVQAFQSSKGLIADGIVGEKTREELNAYLDD